MSDTNTPTTPTNDVDNEFKDGTMNDDKATAMTADDTPDTTTPAETESTAVETAETGSTETGTTANTFTDVTSTGTATEATGATVAEPSQAETVEPEAADDGTAQTGGNESEATESETHEFAETVNFSVVFDDDDDEQADDEIQPDEDADDDADEDDVLLVGDAIVINDAVVIDTDDLYDAEAEAGDDDAAEEELPFDGVAVADVDVDVETTLTDAAAETPETDTDSDVAESDAHETATATESDATADAAAKTTDASSQHGPADSADASSGTAKTTVESSETAAQSAVANAQATAAQSAATVETAAKSAQSATSGTSAHGNEDAAPQAVTDVVDSNAAHVNATLNLAATAQPASQGATGTPADDTHADGTLDVARLAAERTRASRRRKTATAVSSHIDRELRNKHEEILLKSNPTFGFDGVTYRNRKSGRVVIDRLNLAFQAGTMCAVLIPDDDDELRTTLVGLMSGILMPTGGNVMNKSTSYAQLEPLELRGHRVGFIPQRFAVRADMSAIGNVVYTMDASDRTFLKPKKVLAKELLTTVGLPEEFHGNRVGALPEVDQRRVAIARALSCEATIIVADEPTAGLSDTQRDDLLTVLHDVAKASPKRCVIIVTSDETVADAADRAVELDTDQVEEIQ